MTTPDFRALCAELVNALAEWQLGGGPPEDTADADLIDRARAALAAPLTPPPAKPSTRLARYGVTHYPPGAIFPWLLGPMADGYWTPWHVAAALVERLESDNASLVAAADSLYADNISLLGNHND